MLLTHTEMIHCISRCCMYASICLMSRIRSLIFEQLRTITKKTACRYGSGEKDMTYLHKYLSSQAEAGEDGAWQSSAASGCPLVLGPPRPDRLEDRGVCCW